jgi:hypothetical protein
VRLILVDVLLGVLCLAALGLIGFSLYRRVRTLMRTVESAAERVADASTALGEPPVKSARPR